MPGSHLSWCVLGAEVQDGGAEQAPLHAGLDLQGGVGQRRARRSRRCCRRGLSAPPTDFGKARCTPPLLDEQVQLARARARGARAMLRPSMRQNAGSLIICARPRGASPPTCRAAGVHAWRRRCGARMPRPPCCGAVAAPPAGVRRLVAGFFGRTAASAMADLSIERGVTLDGRTPTSSRPNALVDVDKATAGTGRRSIVRSPQARLAAPRSGGAKVEEMTDPLPSVTLVPWGEDGPAPPGARQHSGDEPVRRRPRVRGAAGRAA